MPNEGDCHAVNLHLVDLRVSVIGIGNLRAGPAVIGALSSYFGERHIEVAFFDADEERLELFTRFAHTAFSWNRTPHLLGFTTDLQEAASGAWRTILCLDSNCARKMIGRRFDDSHQAIREALDGIVSQVELSGAVLSLLPRGVMPPIPLYYEVEPLPELTAEQEVASPFQILRWIKGDEYLHEFMKAHENSPIKAWLDDLDSANLVSQN